MPIRGFNRDSRTQLLELIASGHGLRSACRQLGFNVREIDKHVARHRSFGEALDDAREAANDAVWLALYEKALTGDVTACRAWLRLRPPVPRPHPEAQEADLFNVTPIDPRRRRKQHEPAG